MDWAEVGCYTCWYKRVSKWMWASRAKLPHQLASAGTRYKSGQTGLHYLLAGAKFGAGCRPRRGTVDFLC